METGIGITVVCIAYNHAAYIERVLKGIVNQKVNVPFEVIVHDDASTDGTDLIIKKYAEQYPELITAVLQKENQCSKGINVRREYVHPLIKGKYYAWTEGDDFWIYDGKLQEQYDFMENHPECSLCYHNAIDFDADMDIERLLVREQPSEFLTDEEIIMCPNGNYPTTSVFAKTRDILNMPELFWKAPISDHPLRLYLATLGKVYFMNRTWAVRNYNHPESWTYKMKQDSDSYREYCVKYMEFLWTYNKYAKNRFFYEIKGMCTRNFIARFLIEPEEKVSVKEWIEIATDFYSRLSEAAQMFTLEELIEDGIQVCDDYDIYMADVFKPYIENGKKIYIYGAGKEGGKKAFILFKLGIPFEGFLVSDISEQEKEKWHKPIYEFSPEQFGEETIIWLGLNRKNKNEVISLLKRYNVEFISK